MNLKDEEWEPDPTDPDLLRKIRSVTRTCTSEHDILRLRELLQAPPFNCAIPHDVRGTVWLLLLRLRADDLLAEDPATFAYTARRAVADDNSRDQIEKDVARTRAGLARFRQPAVRGALLRLLSLFCARQKVSYVQGFNELLAPFVLLADTGGNPRLVYALFSEFIARFAPWMLETSESRVFDVLKRLFKYFARLLLYHDPQLYWLLERHCMTPDLYATSWFVTLFARNFTVQSVLALWDLLLLEDNPLGTTFFAIALLRSKRDQLFQVDESTIPETLMKLTANSPEQVRHLWKIGNQMRIKHTPPSYQLLMTDRLLCNPANIPSPTALAAARSMQASVCLQTTTDDLIANDAHFFIWDCRTIAEYHSGHLAQAAHLPLDALREANGNVSDASSSDAARKELQNAVDMCEPLKSSTHICLIGSGFREEDNTDVNMLALYLTRIGFPYVSILRGGFKATIESLNTDNNLSSIELVDYDRRKHEAARKARVTAHAKRQKQNLERQKAQSSSHFLRGSSTNAQETDSPLPPQTPTKASSNPISSFLERTDAEVSRALTKALNGIGVRYSLSSMSSGVSSERDNWSTEPSPESVSSNSATGNPFSTRSSLASTNSRDIESNTASRKDVQKTENTTKVTSEIQRSTSSLAKKPKRWTDASDNNSVRRNGLASVENSPRLFDIPSNTMSPRPGVRSEYNDLKVESPIRGNLKTTKSSVSNKKSPWGRDAKPGWLEEETLSYPLSEMPKGFTVNVMDDSVMAGLRLFPCEVRIENTSEKGKSEFKRRFVGVSPYYFLLLSPHNNRSHLLEVKLIRYLHDISRITFKRKRPELVTFEILTSEDEDNNAPAESIVCLMPDGLKACVALIKDFISEEDHREESKEQSDNTHVKEEQTQKKEISENHNHSVQTEKERVVVHLDDSNDTLTENHHAVEDDSNSSKASEQAESDSVESSEDELDADDQGFINDTGVETGKLNVSESDLSFDVLLLSPIIERDAPDMNEEVENPERNGKTSEDVVSNYLSIIKKLPSLWPSIPSTRRQGYLRTLRLIWPSIPPHQSSILSLLTAQIISHVITTDEAENRSQSVTSNTKGYTEQLLETLLGLLTDSFFVSYDDLISYSSLPSTPEPSFPAFDSQFMTQEQIQSYIHENETSFAKTLLPSNAVHSLHHFVSKAYEKASPRPHHLVAAHLLHFLANLAVNESAPRLRRAALHTLAALIRVLNGSLLASFLPGIVSSLTRLLVGAHALPANVVIAALDVFLALIHTAFPQSSNEFVKPSSFSSALRDMQRGSHESNNVHETEIDDEINFTSSSRGNPNDRESRDFRVKRGTQWITQASAELSLRLTLLFTSHEGPRSHQNVRVQSALALFTASLLAKETVFALVDVTTMQFRTILVSLCGHSHPDVKAIATQQMIALVERKHVKLVDIERGLKALISFVNDGDHIAQVKSWKTKTEERLATSVNSSDQESSKKNLERDTIQKLAGTGEDDFWIRLGVGYLVVLKPKDPSCQETDEFDHESVLGVNKWTGFSSRVGINGLVQLLTTIQDALWNLSDDSETAILRALDNPVLHMVFHVGEVGLLNILYPTLLSISSPVNDFDQPEAFASLDREAIAQHLRTFKQRAHATIILQESFRGALARKCSTKLEMSQHGSFIHQTSKELFMIGATFFLPSIETDVSPLLSSEDEALVNIKCCLLYCVSRLLEELSDFHRKFNSRPIGGDIVLVLLPSLLLDVSSGDDTVKGFAERTLLTLAKVTGCTSIRRLLARHLNFTVSRIIRNLEKEWAGNVLRYTIGNESDETSRETTALLEDTLRNMCNNLAGSSDLEAKKTLLSIRSVLSTASLHKPDISDEKAKSTLQPDNLDEQNKNTQSLDENEYLHLKARSKLRKLLLDFCMDDVPNYDKLTEPPAPIKKSIDYWNDDATENENPFETLALNTLDGMRDLLVGRPWNIRAIALECATLAVKLLEGRYKVLLPHAATLLPLLPDQFSVLHEELNAGERVFRAFKRKKAQGKEDGEDIDDLVSFLNTKASELPVVTNACLLLSAFAEHVGSFMQDRFVQLIFPKLRPLLRLASNYPSLMVIRTADGTGELLPTPSYGAMSASDACLEALSSISEYVPEILSTYTLTLLKYLMVFIDSRMYYGETGQRRIEHTNRTMVKYENERMERRVKLANCIVRNLKTVNPGDVLVGILRHSKQKELIPIDQSLHTIQVCDYAKTHNP